MQHGWLVPRPGRIVAFSWAVIELRRFFAGSLVEEMEAALGRYAFVVHPETGSDEVDGLAAGFAAVDRVARRRFLGARAASVASCAAVPAVLGAAAALGMDPAPVFGLVMACMLMAIGGLMMTREGAMRIAREIRELDVPEATRSRVVAEDADLVATIRESERWPNDARHRLVVVLWRIASAEHERREYLDGVEVLDHEHLRQLGASISAAVLEVSALRDVARA
ncbi:hypothetical protein [Isoptericola sp. NPDC055881]